jgi:hypothetical protein
VVIIAPDQGSFTITTSNESDGQGLDNPVCLVTYFLLPSSSYLRLHLAGKQLMIKTTIISLYANLNTILETVPFAGNFPKKNASYKRITCQLPRNHLKSKRLVQGRTACHILLLERDKINRLGLLQKYRSSPALIERHKLLYPHHRSQCRLHQTRSFTVTVRRIMIIFFFLQKKMLEYIKKLN